MTARQQADAVVSGLAGPGFELSSGDPAEVAEHTDHNLTASFWGGTGNNIDRCFSVVIECRDCNEVLVEWARE